jgi:hemerythrin-like metal-binding protein/PAS domain S-box-containing protein
MLWPVATLIAAAVLLVALVLYLQSANRWVHQTDQVIARATLMERLVADRQSRLREYLLTDDPSSYTAYIEADRRVSPAIEGLQALVSDDPSQVERLTALRPVLARWAQYADQELARSNTAAQDVAFHLIDGDAIQRNMQSRLREFVGVEEGRRGARLARADEVTRWAFALGAFLALVAGPALAKTTSRRMRRSRERYREALEAQERMARSLQESEETLRLAEDAAKMGSWHWNVLSGEFVWSDRCKALFGLGPDTVMSREVFLAAVHPDDRDRVDLAAQDALANRTPYQVEMRVPWPDGSVRWVASRGEGVYDANGRAVQMAGMTLDITAQKRAEEAVRESDRRKDEFLGMLSHELRNPLAPIRNSVQLLGRVAPASAQAERAHVIIARQVDHLARLVDDLLDVKRISTGKLRLHTNQMDLTQAVREAVEDIRPLFSDGSLHLHLDVPHQAVWVNGDRTRLAQVVNNLLHNAAKFTDAGGHVSVTVESSNGLARVRVRDDGVGVAPDMLGQLFDPFVQSDRTLHRTKAGLGLGLSLVRGITELHGGTVVVRSEGLGKGTEFIVTLPTVEPTAAVASDEAIAPPMVKRRVLIIEDNVDAAESLRAVVEALGGHEVLVAKDGEAGVAAAAQHCPDVILCDIGLPIMDGYEVAQQVRAGPASGARLIALSGYASPEDINRAIRAGFDYHIAKPPDVDRVLGLIASAPSVASAPVIPADLATGHHELDEQHATIVAQLARLRAASSDVAWESLRSLQQHTASHGQYEEMLMEEMGYSELAAHKQQHADFQSRLRALHERLERDGATQENLGALADAVEAWMKEHVLDQDRRLVEFIWSKGPEPRGEPEGRTSSRRPDPGRPPPRLRLG